MKKLLSLILAILTLALCLVPICASAEDKKATMDEFLGHGVNALLPMSESAAYTTYQRKYLPTYYSNYLGAFYSHPEIFEEINIDGWDFDSKKKEAFDTVAAEYKEILKSDKLYELDEMPLVTFIKRVDIPREVLTEAMRLVIKLDDEDGGGYWRYMPDLDIIYTLDNDVINAYYKYSPADPWSEKGNRKYRYCYYSWVIELYYVQSGWDDFSIGDISDTQAQKLFYSIYDKNCRVKEEPDEMPLVTWIKKCNIPRDRLEWFLNYVTSDPQYKKFYEANAGTEYAELPNLDIIYTFDNKKINEYYSIDNPPYNPATGESDVFAFVILGAISLAAVTVLAKKKRT